MFFILSKILIHLIMPFTVICILLIVSVVLKNIKWKKRLFWTAFSLLIFFSNEFIANEVMAAWEVDVKPFDEMRHYKMAIVLTGSTIPGLLPNDRVYFHRGADRVIHTVQLYKKGLIEKILISGGSGAIVTIDEPEADKFKNAMLLMGVPEEDIILENQTRNTGESAIEVGRMIEAMNFRSEDCLLITSAFHMRRSLACYQKAGLALESFSTDFYAHERQFYPDIFLVPQIDAMMKWHKLMKEWVGMVAYKLVGYI
jgi:uncharacterized SAM-binding protein YcdF (DUF218 family)